MLQAIENIRRKSNLTVDMSKFASNKKILSSVMLLEVTLGVIYIYIYRFSVLGFIFPF